MEPIKINSRKSIPFLYLTLYLFLGIFIEGFVYLILLIIVDYLQSNSYSSLLSPEVGIFPKLIFALSIIAWIWISIKKSFTNNQIIFDDSTFTIVVNNTVHSYTLSHLQNAYLSSQYNPNALVIQSNIFHNPTRTDTIGLDLMAKYYWRQCFLYFEYVDKGKTTLIAIDLNSYLSRRDWETSQLLMPIIDAFQKRGITVENKLPSVYK